MCVLKEVYKLNEEREVEYIESLNYQYSKEIALIQEQLLRDEVHDSLRLKYMCVRTHTYTNQEEYKWLLPQYKYVVLHKEAPNLNKVEVSVSSNSSIPISLTFYWESGVCSEEWVMGIGASEEEAWESCNQALKFFV